MAEQTQGNPELFIRSFSLKSASLEKSDFLEATPVGQVAVNFEFNIDHKIMEEKVPNGVVVRASLRCTATMMEQDKERMIAESEYVGYAQMNNMPPEQIDAVANIDLPRMMEPYVMQSVRDMTSKAGATLPLVNPFDFIARYHEKMASKPQA